MRKGSERGWPILAKSEGSSARSTIHVYQKAATFRSHDDYSELLHGESEHPVCGYEGTKVGITHDKGRVKTPVSAAGQKQDIDAR